MPREAMTEDHVPTHVEALESIRAWSLSLLLRCCPDLIETTTGWFRHGNEWRHPQAWKGSGR